MNLSVTCEIEGRQALLTVAGSLDIASRDRLTAAAADALRGGASTVVVDLSAVTFMDSTGIGALIEIAGEIDDADGAFHVRRPSRSAARLLEVSGLAGQWLEAPPA